MTKKLTFILLTFSLSISSLNGNFLRASRFLAANPSIKSGTSLTSVVPETTTSHVPSQLTGFRGLSTKRTGDGFVNGAKPGEEPKGIEQPFEPFPIFPQFHSPLQASTLIGKPTVELTENPATIEQRIGSLVKDIKTFESRTTYYTASIENHMKNVVFELNNLKDMEPSTLLGNGQRLHSEPPQSSGHYGGVTDQSKLKLQSIQASVNELTKELKAALVEIESFPKSKLKLSMKTKEPYIEQNFKIMDLLIEKNLISKPEALKWLREGDTMKSFSNYFAQKIGLLETSFWSPSKAGLLEHPDALRASLLILDDQDWKPLLHGFLSSTDDFLDPKNWRELVEIAKTFKSSEFYQGLETGSEALKGTIRSLVAVLDDSRKLENWDEEKLVTVSMFANRHLSFIRNFANPKALGEYSGLKNGLIGQKLNVLDKVDEILPLSKQYEDTLAWVYAVFIKRGTPREHELYVPGSNSYPRSFPSAEEVKEWQERVALGITSDKLLESRINEIRTVPMMETALNSKIDELAKIVKALPAEDTAEVKKWLNFPRQAKFLEFIKTRVSKLSDKVKVIDEIQKTK